MARPSTLMAALLALCAPAGSVRAGPEDIGFVQHPGAALPLATPFFGETGAPIPLAAAFGSAPVVLVLAYHRCPSLCGVVLADTIAALATGGLRPDRDYRLLAISIDPAETPAAAAETKQGFEREFTAEGEENGWRFLTGPEPAIRRVADAVGFRYVLDPRTNQFTHPAGIVVATPDGRISSYLLGVGYRPDALRRALRDAAQGTAAPVSNPLQLLCSGLGIPGDSVAGKVIQGLEAGFVLTGIGLAALLRYGRRRG